MIDIKKLLATFKQRAIEHHLVSKSPEFNLDQCAGYRDMEQSAENEILTAFKELNDQLGGRMYTKKEMEEAIEFGTELAQTRGFSDDNDSYIEDMYDKFFIYITDPKKHKKFRA